MMRYKFLFIILLFSSQIIGQKTPSILQINEFFNSKTYIVYEGSLFSSYNIYLKEAIDKEWDITPFQIISYGQFEEKRKEPNSSFLIVTNVQFNDDRTGTTYNFINLLLGGNYYSLDAMPDLVNIPLSLAGQDEEKYVYKLTGIIRFVQKHLRYLKENPQFANISFDKLYKSKKTGFSTKTLFLLKDELAENINTTAKLKSAYPFSVKISSKNEIEELIASKNEDAVFLHIVAPDTQSGNRMCFKVLMSANNSEIYYYDYHTVSARKQGCLLKKDLQKIARYK
ncbi:MAG: hypothetical protein U9R19_11440 [Bacteroidota bacterium]|nr:hypothetical protein [Bacteroidota bacterium]